MTERKKENRTQLKNEYTCTLKIITIITSKNVTDNIMAMYHVRLSEEYRPLFLPYAAFDI